MKHLGFSTLGKVFVTGLELYLMGGGGSSITNNGHNSEKFEISRSTRQGYPISPQIFILGLEILFIALRSDENIKGFKIENNEIN